MLNGYDYRNVLIRQLLTDVYKLYYSRGSSLFLLLFFQFRRIMF